MLFKVYGNLDNFYTITQESRTFTACPWTFLFVIVGSREPPYTTEVHGFFMLDNQTPKSQIKSRQRVADHGEVFTNPREVNAMLDLVRDESFRLDSRFLEPACGDGNFLIEILRRKLSLLQEIKSQTDWEFKSLIVVGSCYGIDILPDNAKACRKRLEEYVLSQHPTSKTHKVQGEVDIPKISGSSMMEVAASDSAASERLNARSAINTIQAKRSVVEIQAQRSVVKEGAESDGHLEEMQQNLTPYHQSLRYMLQKNIVCGDALTYRTSEGKPIAFCEWTPIAGSLQFSRRDFQFDFLVTQSHQYSLFDEQGEPQSFDEPVRTYPPMHYTQLYKYDL